MKIRDGVTIYYVRHGQTQWNARGLAQGSSDIELNTLGRSQAEANGERLAVLLKGKDLAEIGYVSSPLKRAKETMEILREGLGLPRSGYATDPRLKEMGFGVSEGTSWPDYAKRLTEAEHKTGADPWAFAAEGGESYAGLSGRALPFFAEATRDTVVACHGGVSRCVLVALSGMKPLDAINMVIPQDKIMVLRGKELTWE
jgi:broad specificity phosphatase PhoE